MAELPPSVEEQLPFFNVVFSTSKSQIAKLKAFRIRREHYETCAKIRQEVCPTFADVRMIDASAVLPENDVPEHVVNAGLAREILADFAPSFRVVPAYGPLSKFFLFRRFIFQRKNRLRIYLETNSFRGA